MASVAYRAKVQERYQVNPLIKNNLCPAAVIGPRKPASREQGKGAGEGTVT